MFTSFIIFFRPNKFFRLYIHTLTHSLTYVHKHAFWTFVHTHTLEERKDLKKELNNLLISVFNSTTPKKFGSTRQDKGGKNTKEYCWLVYIYLFNYLIIWVFIRNKGISFLFYFCHEKRRRDLHFCFYVILLLCFRFYYFFYNVFSFYVVFYKEY